RHTRWPRDWSSDVCSSDLTGAYAADFQLTPDEARRAEAREVVIRSALDAGQRRGTVRAAIQIDAPPAVVFQVMMSCADAVQYVRSEERRVGKECGARWSRR